MNDDFRSFSCDNNRKPLPADRQSMLDSWRLYFVYFILLFIRNGQRFVSKWKTTNGTEGCRRLLTGFGKGWVKPCTARHRAATRVKHRRWHREEAALALANNLDMKRGRVKSGLLWKWQSKGSASHNSFFFFDYSLFRSSLSKQFPGAPHMKGLEFNPVHLLHLISDMFSFQEGFRSRFGDNSFFIYFSFPFIFTESSFFFFHFQVCIGCMTLFLIAPGMNKLRGARKVKQWVNFNSFN